MSATVLRLGTRRSLLARTQSELVAAAPAATRKAVAAEGRDLMAWSVLRPSGCEVHIVDPAVKYAPEWIGHEIVHCVYGRFHS